MLFLDTENLASQLEAQRAAPPREKDFEVELSHLRELEMSQRDFLYPLHSEWYLQILACHGFHNVNYNLYTGTPYFTGSGRPKPAWNIIGTIANRYKAYIASARPRREVRATDADERDLRAARIGNQFLPWAFEHYDYPGLYSEARDWFVKAGTFVAYLPWDDKSGDEIQLPDGTSARTGETQLSIDSPFRWMLDPRVARSKEAMWARRRTFQPVEWIRARFPDRVHLLREDDVFPGDSLFFEYQLLNLTPLHVSTVGTTPRRTPRDQGFIEVFEYYEMPCDKYPEGRTIIAIGRMGNPEVVVHVGPMPYERLPFVLCSMDTVPGRAFGESPIKYQLYPQQEFNTRRAQEKRNCDAFGSLKLLWPDDGGAAPQSFNNEAGIVAFSAMANHPPAFLQPPAMPDMIYKAEESALKLMDYMAQPAGPLALERATSANSGVQASLNQEQEQIAASPFMENWNNGWVQVDKMLLSNLRQFGHWPRAYGSISADAAWASNPAFTASGVMLTKNITVRLVPGTGSPVSRSTVFAEHVEAAKALLITPEDQMARRRALENIGLGDSTRYWRDENSEITQARDNLELIKSGQPVVPDIMDNPEVQVVVILDWMRTPEYRFWRQMYPDRDMLLRQTWMLFGQKAQEVAMVRFRQSMVQPIAGEAGVPVVPQAAGGPNGKGDPSGGNDPKRGQGFGTHPTSRGGGPKNA